MKILHISTSSSGGAAIAANRLHLGLLKEGVESTILYLHKNKEIAKSYKFPIKKINFFYRVLIKLKLYKSVTEKNRIKTSGLSQNKPMFSFADSDYDITKTKLYRDADIINLHWVSGFLDYQSFFRNNTKKIVWTLHDQNPFTGGCHYSQICLKYTSDCSDCYLWGDNKTLKGETKENLTLKIIALNKKNISIAAPSKWLLDLSSKSTLFGNLKHYHIPYGLDTDIYLPQIKSEARKAFNIGNEKKVLLFISDKLFEERKGFKLLEQALAMINRRDIQLLAVGKKSSSQDNLNIQYAGHISDDAKMVAAYNAADAFILPSLQDNLPNTMLEALSCGVPVIGFPAGGIGECIKTGENGILADDISAASLAKAIEDYLNNKYNFDTQRIRNSAVGNFKDSKQANAYIELYKSL